MRIPRALVAFWVVVLAVVAAGAGWLQYLGPIKPPAVPPARQAGNAIPMPSPLLLTASPADPAWKIPHPGPDGVVPMRYYAARAALPAKNLPYIAIMVAGLGEAEAPSLDAVRELPAAVSLALTPYGAHVGEIADAARAAGHETLMGLPMQVAGEPAATGGNEELRADEPAGWNGKRLDWALSRGAGYAGTTDAIGLTAPETFLADPDAAGWLAWQLAGDGIFLVAATPGIKLPPGVSGRAADVVIDPDQGVTAENTALARLIATAAKSGSAFGVLAAPDPPEIGALAAWCAKLQAEGYTLVPVSTLATLDAHPQ
ncbi:MAG TPA: divergent polysaccharide deacetylase family protein [Acidiphilium sp.]